MLGISFCDAHIHLVPFLEKITEKNLDDKKDKKLDENYNDEISLQEIILNKKNFSEYFSSFNFSQNGSYFACTCAHDKKEFLFQEKLISVSPPHINFFSSFGMHPQLPLIENAEFMEKLLQEKKICAIGETGFDSFPEFRATLPHQTEAWHISLELAEKYGVPVIVHCRKSMDKIFAEAKILRRIKAVVFHSFMGSTGEANAFLRRGINAFFSFGKPLLQGDKSAIACTATLPAERLLLETDAPWQTLKGERHTPPSDIQKVYEKTVCIRKAHDAPHAMQTELSEIVMKNFLSVYKEA